MTRDKSGHHEQIMEAARQEFLTCGFTDASMRRIAAAAGMSAAGLYKHFPSKEEMFAALVEPARQGLIELYQREMRLEEEQIAQGVISDVWENGGDARMAMEYIYEHLDAFRLIVCRSEGTIYENFLHDLAVMEEKTTMAFMDMMKKRGISVHEVDQSEFHLLVTVNVSAVFQAVEHGFQRDEALHYADTLDRFFSKGWKMFFGY